ncbi:uncharacterized protein LOC134266873 [Saccostrea cucullata]|uniref:uncharacterized protein LOC134266873 n=1 Tax=Saccostrea cuccullata TaxID=36930 RepID=UPI002ED39DC2
MVLESCPFCFSLVSREISSATAHTVRNSLLRLITSYLQLQTTMRSKQKSPKPHKRNYRLYSPSQMTNAYKMVKEKKMSVRKASKIFRVPDTTLRDRVLLKVDPETAVFGKTPVLDNLEEANLVNHFKTMAAFGYGFTRQECINIATDYAIFVGKRTPDKPFSMKWMRGFLKRWPELKVLKPRGLEHVRAKMASSETVSNYFENLRNTLSKHDLYGKPHLIFNVDEKGISVDHKPPAVVGDSAYCPQSVTSGCGKTNTILGGGSASGVSVPPFVVFPGKRMMPELLSGASPGASGTVYTKVLSPENVQSGFRRTRIYPLCKDAVPSRYLVPAEVFKGLAAESQENERGLGDNEDQQNYVVKLQEKENHLKAKKSGGEIKERKTMSKIVSGREISENVHQRMKDHEKSQKKKEKDIGGKEAPEDKF